MKSWRFFLPTIQLHSIERRECDIRFSERQDG
jgi:hypothetical protein